VSTVMKGKIAPALK